VQDSAHDPAGLSDLVVVGHGARLAQVERERAARNGEHPAAARGCSCIGGPLLVDDELGPHCLTCGKRCAP
jgi:hypothetical protein